MPRILDSLPALYRDLLPDFFAREVPLETKATCAACAMCEANCTTAVAPVDGIRRFFRPETKCCTFHPRLPNYLVGALLVDSAPSLAEGRARMHRKLETRIGVAPQGVRAPPKYQLLYAQARQAFGRATSMVCPYYDADGGACTVWPFREAVCSTYFCKYVAGADGRRFWMALKTYLSLMEIHLSRYAIYRLMPEHLLEGRDKLDPGAGPLSAEDLDEQPMTEKAYAEQWGSWAGLESEFFIACYEEVRGLAREDVQRLLGLDGIIEQAIVERLHAKSVNAALPSRLKFNPTATVQWLADGSVALASYSEYDAVALPGAAYGLLVEFTGNESVEAVRARLRSEKQTDLSDEVLMTLFRHRVLTEA